MFAPGRVKLAGKVSKSFERPVMTIKLEKHGEGVSLVTLNRPQALNAINADMRRDLADTFRKIAADDSIRVVVITGEGRGFSAGADVRDTSSTQVEEILNTEYASALSLIQISEKPVIAAINGPAAGIGMTLALTCDLRVMAEDAYMMLAFSNINLVPDGGVSYLLTREIGYARAYQLAVEAEKIDAQRCLDWGLVNRVVKTEDVVKEALDWAQSLTERAPIALALTKRVFRAAAHDGLRNAMAYEAMMQRSAMRTEDFVEGVSALMEKRKPKFKGR